MLPNQGQKPPPGSRALAGSSAHLRNTSIPNYPAEVLWEIQDNAHRKHRELRLVSSSVYHLCIDRDLLARKELYHRKMRV